MSCSRICIRIAASSALLLAVVAASAQSAATKPALSPERSCRAYVQKFYAWYVPSMLHPGNKVISDVALDRKDFTFSAELRKALKDDLAASKANSDEIVGLDFDPYLNTQDPAHRYVVDTVTMKNGYCLANVHGVDRGKKSEKPDVIAKLESSDGHWTFVNFLYPQSEKPADADLLAVLKTLRGYREQKK